MSRTWMYLSSAAVLAAGVVAIFFAPVTNRWTERITIETISPIARTWSGIRDR